MTTEEKMLMIRFIAEVSCNEPQKLQVSGLAQIERLIHLTPESPMSDEIKDTIEILREKYDVVKPQEKHTV